MITAYMNFAILGKSLCDIVIDASEYSDAKKGFRQ